MDLSLQTLASRLARYRPAALTTPGLARSAVAILLRYHRAAPEILLMKRAERSGDRWSGQVSLPGGRESPGDADLHATAVRETHEEVGLDLHAMAWPIGHLDTIQARARDGMQPLTITPFVFVQTEEAPVVLNHEATAAFWLPVDRVLAGELAALYDYHHAGPEVLKLPCWHYDGQVIWGLTYRILNDFLTIATRE